MDFTIYEESRLKDIRKCLSDHGLDVYFSGQHKGECLTEYVVITVGATTKVVNFSSTRTYYDILIFVPESAPSRIDVFTTKVTTAMKELFPMIQPTHNITGSVYDPSVKGYTRSIEYFNVRKI